MRHFFLSSVVLKNALLPHELPDVYSEDIRTRESVYLPPVVYLHFLHFLCAHKQKQCKEKKQAFRNLQTTVEEKYFNVNDVMLLSAHALLMIAYTMLYKIYNL